MESHHYLAESELPAGFTYPASYRHFADACSPNVAAIPGLPPWIFAGTLAWAVKESSSVFGQWLVPFAQAVQRDLLCCFATASTGSNKVIVTNPWEPDAQFRYYEELPSFEAWLDFARAYSATFLSENPEYSSRPAWFPGSLA